MSCNFSELTVTSNCSELTTGPRSLTFIEVVENPSTTTLLFSPEAVNINPRKIARGISQAFLNQIHALRKRPDYLSLLEKLKNKIKIKKEAELLKLYEEYQSTSIDTGMAPKEQAVIKNVNKDDVEPESSTDGNKVNIEPQGNKENYKEGTEGAEGAESRSIKNLNKDNIKPQGIKITKGTPILNEENGIICDSQGNPIIFDFSILIDESGNLFALGEESGTGNFGQGRIVVDLNDLSRELFAKVYRLFEDKPSKEKIIKRGGPYAKPNNKKLKREIRKHKALQSLHGFIVTKNKAYLIQERAIGQDLFNYAYLIDQEMNQKPIFITSEHISKLLKASISMCVELQRYHGNKVIHRDVKPENFIYDEATQKSTLVDIETLVYMRYEITKKLQRTKKPGKSIYSGLVEIPGRMELVFYSPAEKSAGTPRYNAPEICKTINHRGIHSYLPDTYTGLFSFASDRYSLGASIEQIFSTPLYLLKKVPKQIDNRALYVIMDIEAIVQDLKKIIPDFRISIDSALEQLRRAEELLLGSSKDLKI